MLIFGGALLLYAALLSSGNPNLLPYRVQPSLQQHDKKGQTRRIAKITAVCALTPLTGGLAGMLLVSNTACIIAGLLTAAVSVCTAILLHKRNRNNHE